MSPYYEKLRNALGNTLLLIPSVAAVIHDNQNRLLLIQKQNGSWSLPAGAIEPSETPDEAIVREVREETGITCKTDDILGVFGGPQFRYKYPNSDRVEYVIVLYRCIPNGSGPIEDVGETKELRYFGRSDAPSLEIPYDVDLLFRR